MRTRPESSGLRSRVVRAGLAGCAVIIMLAGCGRSESRRVNQTNSPTSSAAGLTNTAIIAGTLREVGGPGPGINIAQVGQILVYDNDRFIGRSIASITTDSVGRFNVSVPPGTYFLAGTYRLGATSNEAGEAPCASSEPVVARAGETISIVVACHVP
ncbi:MAG: hypothetical protein JWM76_860 [Pseudonocardiales bacterium]|nr:hypothetical protein [Pseudonocardiales bacterium]